MNILVNNAGVTRDWLLMRMKEEDWDTVLDTNLKGVFFLTQRLLPLLEAGATAEDPARVINIGSIDGIRPPVMDSFKGLVSRPSNSSAEFLRSSSVMIGSVIRSLR